MKKILFLSALMLAAIQALGADVDVTTAQATASRYLRLTATRTRHAAPAANSIQLVHKEFNSVNKAQAVFYIFNTSDSYVIVAGDDRAHEILAHGDSPLDMDNIPCNMRVWLEGYRQQIEYLQSHPDLAIRNDGPRRASAHGYSSVEPLLTCLWDQGEPYNRQCPQSNGELCMTGCGATSLSQIMYYWKYPTGTTPSIPGYTTESHKLSLEALPPTTFDWDNMLDVYRGHYNNEQASAVAKLLRYVGQSETMDYTPSGSGTGSYSILQTIRRFGFNQDVQLLSKENWWGGQIYDDEQWGALIQEELNNMRPILMCAYSPTWSGHAFNIDGYDAVDDTYHVNWGWSGSGNAFFALNAFKGGGELFNVGQQIFVGVEPPDTVPTIKVFSSRISTKAYVDSTATASFRLRGALLTDGVTLKLNDESGFFAIDTESIGLDVVGQPQRVNVSYKPTTVGEHTATITLHSEGADDKVITLNGTCLLETYTPVMLAASDVTESSFNAQWEDATPAHNVVSYNLETVRMPFNEMRLQESFDKDPYSGTSTADWSSKLDEITHTAGWTGSKIYRSNENLLLGSTKSKGWIETPAIDMYGNNGLITVKVTVKSAGEDNATPLKITCGSSDTTIYVDSEMREYAVMMNCPATDKATVKMTTVTGKRVMLCRFCALAGDDYSPVDLTDANYTYDITDTSYMMEGLTSGYYGLRVQTLYTDGTLSPWSNRTRAFIDWKRGDVNHDGEINLADVNEVTDVIFKGIGSASAHTINDINQDGEINIADINLIIDKIMSGE